MLSEKEEDFLAYWSENGKKQKTSLRPLLVGMSAGFLLGISLIVIVQTGWDQRATMVANSKLSSVVFLLAIILIAVFMAFLYRNFRWEMQEQQFLELNAKKKAHNSQSKQP
jgi:formate/nitrite transporter FocA (FNT family)